MNPSFVLAVLAVLLVPFFACPGEAQYPKPTRRPISSYDIARDGRILTFLSNRDDFELIISPNWITEFREKVSASERTGRR